MTVSDFDMNHQLPTVSSAPFKKTQPILVQKSGPVKSAQIWRTTWNHQLIISWKIGIHHEWQYPYIILLFLEVSYAYWKRSGQPVDFGKILMVKSQNLPLPKILSGELSDLELQIRTTTTTTTKTPSCYFSSWEKHGATQPDAPYMEYL